MISTKDEIEKMLDDIQNNVKSEKVSSKNKYSEMSLDELLDTISPKKESKSEETDSDEETEQDKEKDLVDNLQKYNEEISEEISEIPEILKTPEIAEDIKPEPRPQPQPQPEQEYEPEEIPFRKIFDESAESIAQEKKESTEIYSDEDEEDVIEKSGGKKAAYSVIGAIMLIFAVIGIISTARYIIGRTRSFTVTESSEAEFAKAVYPAVIMDIEAFQSGSELSPQQVITAAVWKMIMSGDIDKYDKTFDIISVPAVDIESAAAKLFNAEFPNLEHQTVGSGELKFYYNEESKTYNVPSKPLLFSYKPEVKAVSKDGEVYSVEVDYLQEQPSWMEGNSKFDFGVSKTVKFRIQLIDGEYSILSMEILSVNQVD